MNDNVPKLQVNYATAKTPVLAALHLQIAQTHLLEMMKSEPPGDRPAMKAFELVQQAISLLTKDMPTEE